MVGKVPARRKWGFLLPERRGRMLRRGWSVCPVEVLLTRHGHRTLAGLSRGRIITGILQPYADRPSAALSILKMLRPHCGNGLRETVALRS
jgi:hypothetical protein